MPRSFKGTDTTPLTLPTGCAALARQVLDGFAAPGDLVDVADQCDVLLDGLDGDLPHTFEISHDQVSYLFGALRRANYAKSVRSTARQLLDAVKAAHDSFYAET